MHHHVRCCRLAVVVLRLMDALRHSYSGFARPAGPRVP